MENKCDPNRTGLIPLFSRWSYTSTSVTDIKEDAPAKASPYAPVLAYEEDELFTWLGIENPDRTPPPSPPLSPIPPPPVSTLPQTAESTMPPPPTQNMEEPGLQMEVDHPLTDSTNSTDSATTPSTGG